MTSSSRRVAERAKALKVGNALDPTTQMGPAVTDDPARGQSRSMWTSQLKEGGRLLAGGPEPLKLATPGHYMSPTLIVDTKPGRHHQPGRSVRPGGLGGEDQEL